MENDDKNQRLSFTTDFHFQNGKAYFEGFALETVVSVKVGAKYRVLAKREDNKFWTLKGMDNPLTQDEIQDAIEELGGSISGEEFVFEVFDRDGNEIFHTKFNAADKIPPDGYSSDKLVATSFCWAFELPDYLRKEKAEV